MMQGNKWLLYLILLLIALSPAASYGQNQNLTVVVMVDSRNASGYNTSLSSPGEYQKHAERYLEQLQVPYQVFDVATAAPPSDINSRQLIIASHAGISMPSSWQSAIIAAVNGGTGFVNLDSSTAIGSQSHILTIFGTSGAVTGTASTSITIPAVVLPGSSSPHYIAAMQQTFPPTSGNIVYTYHDNGTGFVATSTSTLLAGAGGTVIAQLGSDPLIRATTYGSGRAVHFGTLDYLEANHFGFLQGMDDLFWRSLVWAARKPFVLRGYPRLFSIQMDDTLTGWSTRLPDIYNPSFTGTTNADGTGGPWKVTGYVYANNLAPGSSDRAPLINAIRAGSLEVQAHNFDDVHYGDMYWNASAGALNDAQWSANLARIQSWFYGNGASDTIPSLSRDLVTHYWDLSNNTGYDLWNSLGIRYITSIQKPGYQFTDTGVNVYGGAERLHAHHTWAYEVPPKFNESAGNESFPLFFADQNYTVGSRSGLPAQNFYLFTTQYHGIGDTRGDWVWPSTTNGVTVAQSLARLETYAWRMWSGLTPTQIYTHDAGNYALATVSDRDTVISQASTWLTANGARHAFMENVGDYIYARNHSTLTGATLNGSQISLTYSGSSADPDGRLVRTQSMIFTGDNEGVWQTTPAFTAGKTLTLPYPPPTNPVPSISSLSPGYVQGEASGITLTVNGSGFVANSIVQWNGSDRVTNFVSSMQLTATIPASDLHAPGNEQVTILNPTPGGGTSNSVMFNVLAPSGSFFDDFNRPDSSLLNNGWTMKYPAGFALLNNQVVDFNTGSIDWHDALNYRQPSEDQRDVEAGAEFQILPATPTGFNLPHVHARIQRNTITQTDTEDAYMFFVDGFEPSPGRAIIARVAPVTGQQECYMLGIPFPSPLQVGQRYRLRFQAVGGGPVTLTGYVEQFVNGTWQNFASGSVVHNTGMGPVPGLFCAGNVMPPPQTNAGTMGFAKWTSNFEVFDNFHWTSLSTATPNPMPTTTGTSPNAAIAQSAGFTLTVNGTNFSPNSVVRWNGWDQPTTYVSATQLTATIAAANIVTSGTALATVFTPPAGGGVSNSQVFTIQPGPPAISRLSPTSGSASGGNIVELHGNSFSPDTQVFVNGVATGKPTIFDPTWLAVTMPAGTPQTSVQVTATNSKGTGTAPGGYFYVTPSNILMQDSFNGDSSVVWNTSPLGLANGWTRTNGAFDYAGIGHTQEYAGNASWTDYTVEAKIQLYSLNNYPGGIRGRVNTATGQAYGVWLLPGANQINLVRIGGWSIDSAGTTVLGFASQTFDTAGYHTLRMVFTGTQIQVYWDGQLKMQTTDSTLTSGAVALDVSSQHVRFEDVIVAVNGAFGPAVTGLTVAPTVFSLNGPTATQQLSVTANYSDGTTGDVSASPVTAYVSSNTAIATVNATGLVTIAGTGTATITASFSGFSAVANVTANTSVVPSVSRVSPTMGSSAGGTTLDVIGSGLSTSVTVKIGANTASILSAAANGSRVTVRTPAGTLGTTNVTVSNSAGSSTLAGGYTYINPSTILFADDFNSGTLGNWTASPLGLLGNWTAANHVAAYNGGGHTQIYAGNANWTNYSVQAKFQLSSANNYPGGLRGRVNTSTGAAYEAWLVPGTSQIRLLRTGGWSVDSAGLTVLQTVTVANMAPNVFHTLQLIFGGRQIIVVYDGTTVIQMNDSVLTAGAIALDVSNQPVQFDDVLVSPYMVTLTGLSVSPPSFTLTGPSATQQLTVTATYSDTSTANVTSNSATTYVSSNTAAATVSSTGLVTAVGNGPVNITASFGGLSATATVTAQAIVPPTISRVSPTQGTSAGGTSLDLIGSGLGTNATVQVGGNTATILSAASDGSRVTVQAPPGTLGPANVVVTNSAGTATLTGGYTYIAASAILFADDFNSGTLINWTASPLGLFANWTAANHVAAYNGGGHTQIYAGNANWSDYTVQVKFQTSSGNNYPGGLRGRVNTSTGAGYEAWLLPASNQIRLVRSTNWHVDTPAPTVLQTANVTSMAPNVWHTLQLVFFGTQISVVYDGTTVIQATDNVLITGAVALDVSSQPMQFDDVLVSATDPALVFATGISVSPTNFNLWAGTTQQLTVTATYSNGGNQVVTSAPQTIYASSNTAIATVSPTGVVSPVANGTATITASYGGYSASVTANVNMGAPTATRVSATAGSTAGGNSMDIYGSNLSTAVTVKIGGTTATVLSAQFDGSRMTVQVPAGTAGPADIVLSNAAGTVTLFGGYTYVAAASVLFADDFNTGSLSKWMASPLGLFSNWSASQHAADYNGGGHTQIYVANQNWTNYSLEVKFQLFSGNNYPGGIRGRVNTTTGQAYEVWLRPGANQLNLVRTAGWSIDTSGLAILQTATVANMSPNTFHRLQMIFVGSQITVVYDGTTIMQTTDSTLASGTIALDTSNQHIQFEDVFVTQR